MVPDHREGCGQGDWPAKGWAHLHTVAAAPARASTGRGQTAPWIKSLLARGNTEVEEMKLAILRGQLRRETACMRTAFSVLIR